MTAIRSIRLSALIGLAAAGLLSASVVAEAGYRDHVSADSYGNLVIYSAAGYKRIVIGQGELAGELSAYVEAGRDSDVSVVRERVHEDCTRPPVFVKGRSYMYGLPDGVMPDLYGPCR
jgi:hypothetical protein